MIKIFGFLFFIFISSLAFTKNQKPPLRARPVTPTIVVCWDKSGDKKIIEKYKSSKTACQENGFTEEAPLQLFDCKTIKGVTKKATYSFGTYKEDIDYTEIQYKCSNFRGLKHTGTITCEGKLVGHLEECSRKRFSLDDWIQKMDTRLAQLQRVTPKKKSRMPASLTTK